MYVPTRRLMPTDAGGFNFFSNRGAKACNFRGLGEILRPVQEECVPYAIT